MGDTSRKRWWSTTNPDVPFTQSSSTSTSKISVWRERRIRRDSGVREFSCDTGEPYYPVPNPENRELYAKYAAAAAKEDGVCFVGRLASYKYFNMDQAILNSLEMFDNLLETGKLEPKRGLCDNET